MKILVLLIVLHVAVIAVSITSVLLRRQGWCYYASIGSLACLSIAPVLMGLFFLTSVPYFNKNLALAVVGGCLYAISVTASIASLSSVLAHRRAKSGVRRHSDLPLTGP